MPNRWRRIPRAPPEQGIPGVILTLAVIDRQGQRPRKHRQQAGGASWPILTAAVKPRSEKGNRRFPAGFPLAKGILQRRHGDSDPLPASLFLAVYTARKRLAGTGVVGPLGAPALPMPLAWAVEGPPNRAPARFSVSAWQTLKIATGATAPVAPQQIRRLHLEPASSLLGLSRWASGRSFADRPPAQWESRNAPSGHLTAGRCLGGFRPPGSE
ncbi:hypothetical protein NDU88_001310 [Pleurodeles waltl]|uniref:Uncharacterized protein n=1 Tax=Pleurodeles waltl TaxID=8319 RepID=A0AAV7LX96_PLEWA|nr:hypothetical protein NDU88_001310 [Pleurodeles waltl]